MQLVRSERMERMLGAQSNNAARYVDGMRPAYPNDTDPALTGRSSNCANRILGRSSGRHAHTLLGETSYIKQNQPSIISCRLVRPQTALRWEVERKSDP